MNIYLTPPQPSLGLQRIADALTRYAPPDVEVVTDESTADLVVLYAIGRCEQLTRQAQAIRASGRKYAVVQVCLRSTQKPHTKHWQQLWQGAEVVWSYYDLPRAMLDDGWPMMSNVNFYHAPLGADAGVFIPDPAVRKLFTIATSGESYLSESVRECWLAATEVDGTVFHVGPRLRRTKTGVVYSSNCNDNELAALYQQCSFVSALRRTEGFELPAIEGLLCGARPICFDTPDYRQWYEPFAVFIEETDRQGVIDQLVEVFKQGAKPVTEHELQLARERFNWAAIIGGFYERLGGN